MYNYSVSDEKKQERKCANPLDIDILQINVRINIERKWKTWYNTKYLICFREAKMSNRSTIAFIGVGNMGGAILGGILESRMFTPDRIFLSDPMEEKCAPFIARGCTYVSSAPDAAKAADCILLAVKPQQIDAVMDSIRPYTAGKLVISIAAGVPIARIAEHLPNACVVRAMPNTPLLIGEGVTALCRDVSAFPVKDDDFTLAFRIFSASGMTVELQEAQINPVTALTSSSIAYFSRFIADMLAWAEENGFPRDEQTLAMICRASIGTSALLMKTDFDPAALEKAVTSPGGTTAEAMKVFTELGLDTMIPQAMDACRRRADELAGK